MGIVALDHVNIRTAQLEDMIRFYEEVVGLTQGERPPFAFNGSWLYCGTRAVVHLVEIPEGAAWSAGSLEHFAFEAEGMAAFLEHLQGHGTAYEVRPVPGTALLQVHLHDPDGNHIHIDFTAEQ